MAEGGTQEQRNTLQDWQHEGEGTNFSCLVSAVLSKSGSASFSVGSLMLVGNLFDAGLGNLQHHRLGAVLFLSRQTMI